MAFVVCTSLMGSIVCSLQITTGLTYVLSAAILFGLKSPLQLRQKKRKTSTNDEPARSSLYHSSNFGGKFTFGIDYSTNSKANSNSKPTDLSLGNDLIFIISINQFGILYRKNENEL
jgi:hypothetical protein